MDIEVIINKLVQLGWIRIGKISGNYQTVYCPIHNDGNERKPSCGILLKDEVRGGKRYPAGFTHCFGCGLAKTMPELVEELLKRHNINQSAVQWFEENIPGFKAETDFEYLLSTEISEAIIANFAAKQIQYMQKPKVEYVSEEELASYRYTVDYMYERKLTDELIEKYDIGYDANFVFPGRSKPTPCITFPVRDVKGRTLFFCRRAIKTKLYNYPTGVTKPLYGIDMIPKDCSSLIICESCINALTAVRYGFNAVALMGTGNSYQIEQLRRLGVREFVLCFDGDDAGSKGVNRMKRSLSDVALVWTIPMPNGKDLNDLEEQEFLELYDMKE